MTIVATAVVWMKREIVKMRNRKIKLEEAVVVFIIIVTLAPGVSGLKAGEITSVLHSVHSDGTDLDNADEIYIDVTFMNTGTETSKYRVYVCGDVCADSDDELEMEPNPPFWVELDVGESATKTLTSDWDFWSVEAIKKKYVVQLKADFGSWISPDIRVVDSETVCCGRCEETCTQECRENDDCCCGGCFASADCDEIFQQGDCLDGGTCNVNCACVGGDVTPPPPTCDGKISVVTHEVKGNVGTADEIHIRAVFKNTGTGKCKYRAHISNSVNELDTSGWMEVNSGGVATLTIVSDDILDLLHIWSVEDIGETYKVELEGESSGIVDEKIICCSQCDRTCPKSTKSCCGGCYAPECDKMEADTDQCDAGCNLLIEPPPEEVIPPRKIAYTYEYRGCGEKSEWQKSRCVSGCCDDPCYVEHKWKSRDEIETKMIKRTRVTRQHIIIPKVSHEKLLDNTKVMVTGIIDQFVDDKGSRDISGTLNVTLDPDILNKFILQVNDSTITYSPMVYPVKHNLYIKPYLYREYPSSIDITKNYTHHDSYGTEREEYGFNKTCSRECPSPKCWCDNPWDRMNVTCYNDSGKEVKINEDSDPTNDCVCPPNDCYPDPCVSNRSFHEDQGARVSNGEFERYLCHCPNLIPWTGEHPCECSSSGSKYREYQNWAKVEGDVERVPNGFSGYCAKLENDGVMRQWIAPVPLHVNPHNMLCFMYGLEECESGGYLKLYVNGVEEFGIECDHYNTPCDLPSGWKSECVALEGDISRIEFRSKKMTAYIDNVNLGEYYDFISMYTAEVHNMTKYFNVGFLEYDFTGFLMAGGDVIHNFTDHRNSYIFDFNTLKISYISASNISSEGTMETITLLEEDIRNNANITIHSHFRNKTIKLFPPSTGSPDAVNPYVNVTLREASRLEYDLSTKPYLIRGGEEVTCRVRLTYYDTGVPVGGEPIYVIAGKKEMEFLSPQSLIDYGYVNTSSNGRIEFTFKLHCVTTMTLVNMGHMKQPDPLSPNAVSVTLGSVEFRSPFFRGGFLISFIILIIILITIILSYRLFKKKGVDVGEWIKELRGEE